MRVDVGQRRIEAACIEVVDQHPYTHTAVGRSQQLTGQEPPGEVVVPHVVLHVEAARGQGRGPHAQCKGVLGAGNEPVRAGIRREGEPDDRSVQRAVAGGRQCAG